MSRRRAPSLPPLLWAFGALLLSRWPAALALAPVLLVLQGPMALVLVALAVGVSLARAGRREPEPLPDPGPRRLFAASALVFVSLGLWYTSRLRVTGDEPHYLVMARSLWHEGDLDLRDNYEREDWRADTPGPVRPHYGAPRKDGRPFPAHSPGLPLLLALPDAAFGRAGCVLVLALLAAWLGVEVRALALRATGDPASAVLAWAAASGPPLAAYAFHLYTEVPSALAVAVGLRLLQRDATVRAALGAALAASALPWLHVKMVPAAAALGVTGLVLLGGNARRAFAGTAALLALGYATYYVHVFGQPTPLAIYGGRPADASGSPAVAAVGLFLDRSFGLLPVAPVFLLALGGLVPLVHRAFAGADAGPLAPRRPAALYWPSLAVGLAIVLPVLPWRMWWGGQCPPARFLVPAVPVLALGVALLGSATASVRGLMRWRAALLGVGAGLLLLAVADPGRLLLVSRANVTPRLWDALAGGASPAVYLPSLTRPSPADGRLAATWIAAVLVLLALDSLARSRDRIDRLFRGLGLPLLLLLGVGLAVDHWARVNPPQASAPSALQDPPEP